ncbi:OpcA/G6PD domain-containing protein, partial [Pseudarthrobacter sp. NPDC055928]|uniref:OpcA/G6PD domain-containing protein n=1 Tax=Pseudarthrobacter sp. NPDC055928 TaxID=3345661 RepID=UPI0035DB5D2F
GQPAQRISLPRRSLRDCLAEELRRLDPDEVFGQVVQSLEWPPKIANPAETAPAERALDDCRAGRLVHA